MHRDRLTDRQEEKKSKDRQDGLADKQKKAKCIKMGWQTKKKEQNMSSWAGRQKKISKVHHDELADKRKKSQAY